jgi:flagellin-like hook-associated protein FlgL
VRVTQNMMYRDAINWTAKQAEKLNSATVISASGKQINRPSDDPSAAGKIIGDRTTISAYTQSIANIDQANTWIETSSETLTAVNDLLSSAEDIIQGMASDSSYTTDSALEQLESIYDQVVDLANTTLSSRYMFSGSNVNTIPFADEVDISDGTAADIVFALAGDASDVTIEITDADGNIVRTLTVSDCSEGTNKITWNGCDDDGNLLSDGSYDFTVMATDTGGDAVAEYAAYRGDDGGKTVIIGENSTVTLNNNGGAIFSETLSVLSQAITALKNSSDVSDLASELVDSLEEEIKDIKVEQITLSNIQSQLETADTRLDSLTSTVENEISTIETGSTEEAAVKLSAQETAYEVTLKAVSNVLTMPKLSDYI